MHHNGPANAEEVETVWTHGRSLEDSDAENGLKEIGLVEDGNDDGLTTPQTGADVTRLPGVVRLAYDRQEWRRTTGLNGPHGL